MEYEKNNPFLDFAFRTQSNLKFIEDSYTNNSTDTKLYEVTQFINSLLGLLIFLKEEYWNEIPNTPLLVLENNGWPHINTIEGRLPDDNLQQLVRYMRNGVSHRHMDFLTDENKKISGIVISNYKNENDPNPNWKAQFSIEDIKLFVDRFVNTILEIKTKPS